MFDYVQSLGHACAKCALRRVIGRVCNGLKTFGDERSKSRNISTSTEYPSFNTFIKHGNFSEFAIAHSEFSCFCSINFNFFRHDMGPDTSCLKLGVCSCWSDTCIHYVSQGAPKVYPQPHPFNSCEGLLKK